MMIIARRIAHSSFTLTRDYRVPVAQVWRAFAEEDRKREWFGDGETFDRSARAFDFRVGGTGLRTPPDRRFANFLKGSAFARSSSTGLGG